MPIYEYECDKCNEQVADYRVIEARHRIETHTGCGGNFKLIFSSPIVRNEQNLYGRETPYFDYSIGKRIESRSHWKKVLKEKGSREVG